MNIHTNYSNMFTYVTFIFMYKDDTFWYRFNKNSLYLSIPFLTKRITAILFPVSSNPIKAPPGSIVSLILTSQNTPSQPPPPLPQPINIDKGLCGSDWWFDRQVGWMTWRSLQQYAGIACIGRSGTVGVCARQSLTTV